MTELFRWYLARMRVEAKHRGEQLALTPMTLVSRDKDRIQELVAKSSAAKVGRRADILKELQRHNKSVLGMVAADKVQSAIATMLAALDGRVSSESYKNISLEEVVQLVVRELQEAREGERLIADCTPDLLCCLDADLKIEEVNVEFELTVKYPRLSLLGAPIDLLIAASDKEKFKGSETFESALRTKDGESVDIEWNVEWSPTSSRYFCHGRNIAERKQRERLQAEVSSMISHDLRVPVTGVALVLQNIADGTYGSLSESGIGKIERARASIGHMLTLIDDLLDAEKLTAGEMPVSLSSVRLSDVYERCQLLVKEMQDDKKIAVEFPVDSKNRVEADCDCATRVLCNLVGNAIKYCPAGSSIKVSDKKRASGGVVVSVEDNGPGIPEELRPVLFDRYKAGAGGTGLGLFIAKKLTELQGGEIGFESQAGSGSRFWFTLPSDSRDL